MRSAEERVNALHKRMKAMEQARERRKTALMGTGCGVLTLALLVMVFTGSRTGGTTAAYSGAMMLFEGAGGYVLAAVAAFMIGVIITVTVLATHRKQEARKTAEGKDPGDAGEEA